MGTIPVYTTGMNTKYKADICVGQAIGYYSSKGIQVLLPIGDKKPYDLVIDKEGRLLKVQCKYTSFKSDEGIYIVGINVICRSGKINKIKSYENGDFDLMLVMTADNELYELPFSVIHNYKSSINLGKLMQEYRVNG